jgi:alkylhydroperoxidase family enzyme
LLEFVEALSARPWTIDATFVTRLRWVGFGEVEIFHAILGSAHFNYLNRMADGLGIRLEYESVLRAPDRAAERTSRDPLPECPPRDREFLSLPTRSLPMSEDEPVRLIEALGANGDAQLLTLEWHRYHLGGTDDLGAALRARMAFVAARLAGCGYLSAHYAGRLRSLEQSLGTLEEGRVPDDLPERDRVILAHTARLSLAPGSIVEEDVEALRRAGCSDRTIVRVTMLAAYVAFESRVALGLGIPAA